MTKVSEHHSGMLRIGRFSISRSIIDRHPVVACKLLRDIVIVRAELNYATDAVEYTGLSEKFDLVNRFGLPPQYLIEIEGIGLGNVNITRVPDIPNERNTPVLAPSASPEPSHPVVNAIKEVAKTGVGTPDYLDTAKRLARG